MRKCEFHDDEERDLITAYESGEFRPVKDQQEAKQTAIQAARRYMRKDARVNIRLSTADLEMLKRRAAEEGLPYQSLIASVLHKYVSGSIPLETRVDEPRVTWSVWDVDLLLPMNFIGRSPSEWMAADSRKSGRLTCHTSIIP
jgi:predicted DNA binding CopG/RHH family protein